MRPSASIASMLLRSMKRRSVLNFPCTGAVVTAAKSSLKAESPLLVRSMLNVRSFSLYVIVTFSPLSFDSVRVQFPRRFTTTSQTSVRLLPFFLLRAAVTSGDGVTPQ